MNTKRVVSRETQAITAPADGIAKVAIPTMAVVLPAGARPGVLRVGDYKPGVTYHVDPDTAARLMARGFELAAAPTDTAEPAAVADGAGGGFPINQQDEE